MAHHPRPPPPPIERVVFDDYVIRTWYTSPYPIQAPTLWICHGCLKYMRSAHTLHAHRRTCTYTHPPGRKVYQRGAHILWEVDGAQEKLYVQNLCLLGKLFIDHKTVFFDVAPFWAYVLTDASSQFDHVLGFFSKEKVSYDHYNLACIVVFPPYQRRGYGTLLMEYSYHLSRSDDTPGTPERPLSDLGLKGYMAYWSAQLVRTLLAAYSPEGAMIRAILAGHKPPPPHSMPTSQSPRRRRQRRGGWAGEERAERPDEPLASIPHASIPMNTTLARIADAAGLRSDDATLALAHAGLLDSTSSSTFVLSLEAIQQAAQRLSLRPPILDVGYCL